MARGPHGEKALRDLIGASFGSWRVLERASDRAGRVAWLCECVCGAKREVFGCHLSSGRSASCGCGRARGARSGRFKHGLSGDPLHALWLGMIARCENKQHRSYPSYGGRGVRVCPRWRQDFSAFLADMGPRPSARHSLDRYPDGDGNYAPENVRWASPKEQARNQRSNRRFVIDGVNKTLAELVEERGANYGTVKWRLNKGQSIEEALR